MNSSDLELLKNSLPETPGILGRGEYPNSVVMVLMAEIEGEYHFVLQERNPNIRQGGEVCFPGGMFDEGRDTSSAMTALRETSEELGVPADRIEIIGRLDTIMSAMGTILEIFVGILHSPVSSLKINRDEVEKVFTLPVSYFMNNEPDIYHVLVKVFSSETDPSTGKETVYLPVKELGLPDRYLEPWGNLTQKVYVYKTPEGTVWGLTARIITDFIRILRHAENKITDENTAG